MDMHIVDHTLGAVSSQNEATNMVMISGHVYLNNIKFTRKTIFPKKMLHGNVTSFIASLSIHWLQ